MASLKPSKPDQKNGFQYLKKGSGLQSRRALVNMQNVQDQSKRKANFSPKKDELLKKPLIDMNTESSRRETISVGNMTNLGVKSKVNLKKADMENVVPNQMKLRPRNKQQASAVTKFQSQGTKYVPNPRVKLPQKYAANSVPQPKCLKPSGAKKVPGSAPIIVEQKTEGRASLDSSKGEDNLLYVTALEDSVTDPNVSDSKTLKASSSRSESSASSSDGKSDVTLVHVTAIAESSISCPAKDEINSSLPPGVEDYDAETWNDPFLASCYAMHIFTYLKSREVLFPVDARYMEKQKSISTWMRSLLVDWMVEIQETFELNHETLYLAVKILDLFLSRHKSPVPKQNLQLVGTTALFIASKFDERLPPTLEDFKFLCDEAYSKSEIIRMEETIIKALDFNLGIPISYRFLRRYARCCKASIEVLTLARYILESSLMDYSLISSSDSKIAAAALLLARKMKNAGGWSPTLEYYTGYTLSDIKELTHKLNAMIHKKPHENLSTVLNKYSHKVFHEVAKIPLISDLQL